MKNLLYTLIVLLGAAFSLQAQTDYKQWESHYFKAKPGEREAFEKGLAEHHKKFHNEAPFKASIFNVVTGPHSGMYDMEMGPMTFTQMENRPSSAEHDEHWAKVMEHGELVGETVYWRADKDIDYKPEGSKDFGTYRWRYVTLLPGGGDRYEALMEDVIAVFKAKGYNRSFNMYWRFGASEGANVVTELGMKNMASFDEESTWRKDFEEVHGEGSYQRFLDDLDLCTDRSKTYDEVVNFNAKLSSDY